MHCTNLSDFYQRDVLPQLSERLDRAFPEFHWKTTTNGWTSKENSRCCNTWGFVDQNGHVTNWLSYVNETDEVASGDFVATVKRLARLAGVDDQVLDRPISHEEIEEAIDQHRQRNLLEHFVAYCQAALLESAGSEVRHRLHDDHGINCQQSGWLPIGVYSDSQDVGEHLVSLGFSREEILESALAGDPRLPGRLISAWRDQWSCIRTIVARDLESSSRNVKRDLFLRGGTKTLAFGLDVALRSSSGGREHLVLVDEMLDVVYLQSLGVCNVAALGTDKQHVTKQHWEKLADQSVKMVTLAVADSSANPTRTSSSIHSVNKAKRSPQVFTVVPGDLGDGKSAAAFAQTHGLEAFRQVLKQRVHGYRHIAVKIVNKHKTATSWSETQLTEMLGEAVQFDSEVEDRQRAVELERFFWPTILEATGLDWETLRDILGGRFQKPATQWTGKWHARNLKQLLRELKQHLRAEEYQSFKELLCAAARDLEDEVLADRPSEPKPPVKLATWSVPKPEPETHIAGPFKASAYPVVTVSPTREQQPPKPAAAAAPTPQPPREIHPTIGDIRSLAYYLWENRGHPDGIDRDLWIEAEQKLKSARRKLRVATWDSAVPHAA